MNFTSENVNESNAREVCFVRNPEILKRQIEDTIFLVNPDDDTIFYLNPLSTGIWHLLAEPTTPTDAVRIVQQAFPDTLPEKIARDVLKLIKELEGKGLVLRRA